MLNSSLCLQPIGVVHSPYREKFSVPRQPDLVQDGMGILELLPPFNHPDSVRGLDQFSHIWLIFQFNQIAQGKWTNLVRPPRLGGNQRVGVFASRSTHRPNPLGLSKVKLRQIEIISGKILLHLGALDLVDGTPIFDIKPYITYADSEPLAYSSFAQNKPVARLQVEFNHSVLIVLEDIELKFPHFTRFIRQLIEQDPRPAYQQDKLTSKIYGMTLYDYNIRWRIKSDSVNIAEVIEITKIN